MLSVALVSTYEGGMQPLGLATAASHLIAAGHAPDCYDSFLAKPSLEDLCGHDLIAFSVPLFESLGEATNLFNAVKAANPEVRAIFYGTYSILNREVLLAGGAAGVVVGDWEDVLPQVAAQIEGGRGIDGIEGLATGKHFSGSFYKRSGHRVPHRASLPALSMYQYPEAVKRLGKDLVVGNVETARGCRFKCSYCSVFAATNAKVTIFPEDLVLEDIAQVVELGATHICFMDAEFLNAPAHALGVVKQMHKLFPSLTFDFTTRADLIAEDPKRMGELVEAGGKFVTSAFEFPKEKVLRAINKEFTVDTLRAAVKVCRSAGLGLNPTFLLFNPWIGFEDLNDFTEFVAANGLEEDIDPIQLQTRLWLYKGSPLLRTADVSNCITKENPFNFEWENKDGDVEQVFRLASNVETDSSMVKRCCLKC